MARFLYTQLLRVLAPLIWLWMAVRARKAGGAWGILSAARFGRHIPDGSNATHRRVWIHAVSLGETRAAQPLVNALLHQGYAVLLTHTTATGRSEGTRLFASALKSGQLEQTWLPYDFPGAVRRFLSFFNPRCGILIEREVWPNLQHAARSKGIAMLLVSARFSESSLQQFEWLRPLLRPAYASLALVTAQTQADADRLAQTGIPSPLVSGNLKFDVALSTRQLEDGQAWHRQLDRPVIVFASTREDEEILFLDAIERRARDTRHEPSDVGRDELMPFAPLYVIVPRHPQRFDEVASLIEQRGLPFARRSLGKQHALSECHIFLGDSIGEMAFYYGAADVVIVAGGFAPLGGQNLIEACAAGLPVIVGPHMFNFLQATVDAIDAGAAIQVNDAGQALAEAEVLLAAPERRHQMANAAVTWTTKHRGATSRILQAIRPWLGRPDAVPSLPALLK